ncbi:MAG TPA: YeeE/YedE family protein [Geobacteraceae bacterium]|nr:YeeE/YedE family protein [Geobacteraceae bacterium]
MATTLFMILCGTLLGLAAGFIMHRADFCLAGMFRDLFLFRTAFKLRILLLLIITSMLLFETARLTGLLRIYPFPLLVSPSLAAPLGGMLFGTGMVLAGGCVVGSLYKAGAGSITSLVAIIGMVAGSAIFAELAPWWSSINRAATFLKGKITLADALGISPSLLSGVVLAVTLPFFAAIYRRGGWVRPLYVEGSLQPWLAALLLALIGVVSAITIGMPLGITTSYAKAAAMAEAIVCPAHYESVTFFHSTPLQYTQPLTGTELRGGPGAELDAVALVQFPLIFGIVAGSTFSAARLREFSIHWKAPPRQYLSAVAGGILMGLASRMAAGCNVWHLLGGLPIMAMQSMLFLFGLLPGAWFGAKLLTRFVIR